MKKVLLGIAVLALTFTACKEDNKNANEQVTENNAPEQTAANTQTDTVNESGQTVADIAMADDQFSTLVQAIQAAGLGETLQSDGPFTVFAPTNQAFSKLPENTLTDLLKPENKAKLTDILTYHVVPGEYTAADIKKAIEQGNGEMEISTVEGAKLTASLDGDKVIITDENQGEATVEQADVKASNGIIHGINTVLIPKAG